MDPSGPTPAFSTVLSSTLARHIGTLCCWCDRDQPPWSIRHDAMAQLAQRATELTELSCTCVLPPAPVMLAFPRKLQFAALTLTADNDVGQLHTLFAALNQLSLVDRLVLEFDEEVPPSLDFTLLHPPALRSLSIMSLDRTFTDQQLDSFRRPFFANLESLNLLGLASDRLRYLLRTPCAAMEGDREVV